MKNRLNSRPGFAFGVLMTLTFILFKLFTAATVNSVNIWPMIGVSIAQGVACGLSYGWVMKFTKRTEKSEVE